ncbi:MAG: hypothetical protein K8R36_11760, partial [Planctomycetales bacterium]|nr:hypothetical protein [Planctomycetales bacterium]
MQMQNSIEFEARHAVEGEQAVVVVLALQDDRAVGNGNHLLAKDWVPPIRTRCRVLKVGGVPLANVTAN